MKTIQLKTSKEIINGQESVITTSDLFKAAINQMPQGGYTIDEMRSRFKLMDVIEKAEGELNLEDADYEKLKTLMSEMRWAVLSPFIMKTCDEL